MGDLVVMLIVVLGAICALRTPWIGAVLSVWVSLMSPHIEFGWRMRQWPVALVLALATLIGWLMTKDRTDPLPGAPVKWLIAFWAWICITLPFSFHFAESLSLWERSMKIYLLVFITLGLINTRVKLEWLIIVIVMSLGFYGVKGGVFTLTTGGNFRVWGPGGFVEGNNELALALVMLLPYVMYIYLQAQTRLVRWCAMGTLLLLPFTILGSHSRGALLALAAMGVFLWLKSERKFVGGILLVLLSALALGFMPEHWWERMHTIQQYDVDDSALGRINSWWAAWNVARDNFFGGGFDIYTASVWARYAPNPASVNAAHSIYFQVLGEHGFVGLALFLGIGVSTWMTCRGLARASRDDPELKWAAQLAAMTQVSMIGFAVGGAFLSLAYFDLPYYGMVIVVVALRLVQARRTAAVATGRGALASWPFLRRAPPGAMRMEGSVR
jgi:putative inorganic carbon (HCO3(-)) transporter